MTDAAKNVDGYLKVLTGFATGALAFDVGVLLAPVVLPNLARACLVAALLLLGACLVLLTLAEGGLVHRALSGDENVGELRVLVWGAAVALALGCAAIFANLVIATVAVAEPASYRVQSPQGALDAASAQLRHKPCRLFDKLPTVELIRALDAGSARGAAWHVHVDLRQAPNAATARCPAAYDVFVDARTATTRLY